MSIQIGLEVKGSEEVTKVLNTYLANLHILYTKLHNYHWNVEGRGFFQLHSKLEELYDATAEELDAVAERILTLGFRPAATLKEYLELATLKEVASVAVTGDEVIKTLQADFASIIGDLRAALKIADGNDDQVTVDLLVGSIGNYEKTLWMFRAFLS